MWGTLQSIWNALNAFASGWNDLLDLAGLVLTLIGFAITITNVRRSKSAAEQARQATIEALDTLSRNDAIADRSSAMAIMDEIRRLQRYGAWAGLPDRYAELRRRLIAIKESTSQLNDGQKQVLQGTVEKFAGLEKTVERATASGSPPPNPPKLNEIVSAQIDEVHAVLLSLRRAWGSGNERR